MIETYLLAFVLVILKLIERSLLKWPASVCKDVNKVLWPFVWFYYFISWYGAGAFYMVLVPSVLCVMPVLLVEAFLKLYSLHTKNHPGPAKYFLTQGRYIKADSEKFEFISFDRPLVSFKQPSIRLDEECVFSKAVEDWDSAGTWACRGITQIGLRDVPGYHYKLLARSYIPVIGYQKKRVLITIDTILYTVDKGVDPVSMESLARLIKTEVDDLLARYDENYFEEGKFDIKPWIGVSKGEVLAYQIRSSHCVDYKAIFPEADNSFLCLAIYDQPKMRDRIESFPVDEYIAELVEKMEIKCASNDQIKFSWDDLISNIDALNFNAPIPVEARIESHI